MEIVNDRLSGQDANIIPKPCPKNTELFQAGLPDTIIIHFTAGDSAESSANYLANNDVKASAHLVIGRNGEIYQLVPFNIMSWHAGESRYGDRIGYNKYSIGIEIANAGKLQEVGTELISWFGKKYSKNEAIYATHRNQSEPAFWHIYTPEQIEVCKQICDLLIKKYGIKEILGHEEIAPKRKEDPGPAYPLDELRTLLLNQNRDVVDPVPINKKATVSSDFLNIREGAGVNYKKVAQPLINGTEVNVIEEKDGWCKVETITTGWVSKAYLIYK